MPDEHTLERVEESAPAPADAEVGEMASAEAGIEGAQIASAEAGVEGAQIASAEAGVEGGQIASAEADVEVEREQDAPEPAELDAETRARRDAALRHVRKLGDPVLRAKALPVERFDETLGAEIERMGELMHDALGIGLAATQLGVLHRVLVYRAYPEDPLTALVNPELVWESEERALAEEGCLSLPGVHVEVDRPASVRVKAQDAAGEPLEIAAEGLVARVIQHEIDHLDGVLILDRIPRQARKEAMRAMREARETASA